MAPLVNRLVLHNGPPNWDEMLTGEIRNQVDRVWDAFWSGGISNPLEVIEQITYLLFLRRLDDLQTAGGEQGRTRLKKPWSDRVFPEGKDAEGRPYEDLRWSRFRHFAPDEMYDGRRPSTSSPSCAPSAATARPTRTT